jgi:hypothetical protein
MFTSMSMVKRSILSRDKSPIQPMTSCLRSAAARAEMAN